MKFRTPLLENMASLLLLQGANYALPLITFPYLVRVLGVEGFGLNAFAQSFAAYFVVVTDYGFALSATRAIAVRRDRPEEIARVFSSVLAVKLLLVLGCALVLLVTLLVTPMGAHWPVHAAAFLGVVGTALFPAWLFQGFERMRYVTVVNVGSKSVATAAVFVFVRDPGDYWLAVALQSAGAVLAGAWGLLLARHSLGVRFRRPAVASMRDALRDGWHVFVSQAATSAFGNSNVFVLGLFAEPAVVGRFAIAEKIVRAVIGLSVPVTGAIFPVTSAMFGRSREEALAFLRRVASAGGLLFLAAGAALFVGADVAVKLVAGQPSPQVATWIRIMSALPLSVFVDNLYGTQILLNIGEQRRFMVAVLVAGVFSVLASLVAVPFLGGTGSALVFTASELLVLVLMISFVHRAGVRLLGART